MDDLERLALAFDAACRRAEVPYAFIGGMAVITWGQPRFTTDLDTLVRLRESQDASFAKTLFDEGLRLDAQVLASAREDPVHVSMFNETSEFHLAVKLAATSEVHDQVESTHSVTLGEKTLRVASPEDIIAFKIAYGSPQDLQDARSILIRQHGRLDIDRLRRTASRLGVLDEADAIRSEVDEMTDQ